jgi:uncharacterized SAM-binding protein YcdF (DUF218 family)
LLVAKILSLARGIRKRTGARPLLKWALLLLLAWPPLAWGAARWLIAHEELPGADAILVLGGSFSYVERTHRAAELYREGRAPKILLTNDAQRGGWSSEEQRNPLFVERAAEELRRQGVPPEAIEVLPGYVASTYDEGVVMRQYADRAGTRAVLVVTSAYHSRRALWTMRRAFAGSGVRVGMAPAPTGGQTLGPALWWLDLLGWELVVGEYVKMVYYWAHYG